MEKCAREKSNRSQKSAMQMRKVRKQYWRYFNYSLSLFFGAFGSFLIIFSKDLINQFIDNNLKLKPNSEIVRSWCNPDVNISIDFYLFNWTNSNAFNNLSAKPKFTQVGPYKFTEVPIKEIVSWHPDNESLDYQKVHLYYFNETSSNGTLKDSVISINTLLVGSASKTRHGLIKRLGLNFVMWLYNNQIFWNKTVEELLFKGFHDKLINLLVSTPKKVLNLLDVTVPVKKLGYLYGRNGTSMLSGIHTIGTGVSDMNNFGQLKFWKGENKTKYYASECAQVQGSPGEFQLTRLKKYQSIRYFSSDLCRSVELEYVDEVWVDGVLGYRYKLGANVFDNGTLYPQNKCYCNGECLPSGAINISSCWYNLPIFVSQPHFLDADNFFLSQVDGLQPYKDLHDSYSILEPRTGFILEFRGRMQLNIHLAPNLYYGSYRNRRKLLFPILWSDAYMRASPRTIRLLKLITNLHFYCQLLGTFMIAATIIIWLWLPARRLWLRRYAQHMEINEIPNGQLVEENDENILEDHLKSNKESLLNNENSFMRLY